MRQRFLNKPNSQPLVYLEVSTVKLYGDPESYHKMFRKKPLSYLIREFNDIDVGRFAFIKHTHVYSLLTHLLCNMQTSHEHLMNIVNPDKTILLY